MNQVFKDAPNQSKQDALPRIVSDDELASIKTKRIRRDKNFAPSFTIRKSQQSTSETLFSSMMFEICVLVNSYEEST